MNRNFLSIIDTIFSCKRYFLLFNSDLKRCIYWEFVKKTTIILSNYRKFKFYENVIVCDKYNGVFLKFKAYPLVVFFGELLENKFKVSLISHQITSNFLTFNN